MTALLIVLGYIAVGGYVGQRIYDSIDDSVREPLGIFGGVCWPIAVPLALGVSVAKRQHERKRLARAKARELRP